MAAHSEAAQPDAHDRPIAAGVRDICDVCVRVRARDEYQVEVRRRCVLGKVAEASISRFVETATAPCTYEIAAPDDVGRVPRITRQQAVRSSWLAIFCTDECG